MGLDDWVDNNESTENSGQTGSSKPREERENPDDPRWEVHGIEYVDEADISFYRTSREDYADRNGAWMADDAPNTVEFTKAYFEGILDKVDLEFKQRNFDWTQEYVYSAFSKDGKFELRVYSSVDKRTGESRSSGDDRIRVAVLESSSHKPIFKEKGTNRTPGFEERLLKKIQTLLGKKDEVTHCDECGSVMVIREASSSGNKFYGCINYPTCENTKSLD